MDPISKNLKRAYRETEPPQLPPELAELLRKLREQDEGGQS
ncbi:hypothetical protein [Roseovarius sp. Pro17]|nr:hypothetical protein [Roseovarius sp. Pro17]